MRGDTPVSGDGPSGELQSEGFRLFERGQVIVFTGKARLLIYPEAEETVPGDSAGDGVAPEEPASDDCRCEFTPDEGPSVPWSHPPEIASTPAAAPRGEAIAVRPPAPKADVATGKRGSIPPPGRPPLHLLHQVFLI